MRAPPDTLGSRLEPPLVLIGMHRSGTTLTAEMLRACGLYLGRRLGHHHEARFFQALNRQVLASGGGSWDRVRPYLHARADLAFRKATMQALAAALATSFRTAYLSLPQRAALAVGRPFRWGWKDPRTCLVLPQWLALFPRARLLHIVRHPLDVALSLRRREEQNREQGKPFLEQLLDLGCALDLWEAYVGECARWRDLGERYLEVRFEDLLAGPVHRLRELCRFAALRVREERLAAIAARVDASRQARFAALPAGSESRWLERAVSLAGAREFGYGETG
jgi:hypothetical protein